MYEICENYFNKNIIKNNITIAKALFCNSVSICKSGENIYFYMHMQKFIQKSEKSRWRAT